MPISINTGMMKYKDPATGNFVPLNAIGDDLQNIIAPSYSDLTFPISAGALCLYNGALYKANTDISSSEAWTAAHWTETTVEDELNVINGKADKANPVFTGSVSMGRKANTSVGNRSFAVGNGVEASGNYSHAEGLATTASGNCSHTEGNTSVASGSYSHAEGIMTTASGSYSHAEGNGSVASGSQSHAEGMGTASGSYSHAEGMGTASGVMSHAGGSNTIANSLSQYVFGENNVADPGFTSAGSRGTYVEIVGNGTDNNARSNARTLDWDGNEELAGDLKVFAGTNDEVSVSNLKSALSNTALEKITANVIEFSQNIGRIVTSDGSINNDQVWRVTPFIKVPPAYGVYYHVCTYKSTGYCLAAYYDSNKILIGVEEASRSIGGNNNYNEGYLVIPSTAVYFRLNMWTNNPIPDDRANQYIIYYENNIEKKVSIDQGINNAESLLFINNDGMVVPNKELATKVNKIGSSEMLSDEDTITGSIAEINSKNIVSSIDRNLLTNGILSTMTVGRLINTNGMVATNQTDYLTSDYIPFDIYEDYLVVDDVYIICCYDSKKVYKRYYDAQYLIVNDKTTKYIRVSILASNINTAVICPFSYYDETHIHWKKPIGLNANGKAITPNLLSDITENDKIRFSKGANLFDLQKGFLWCTGAGSSPYNPQNGTLRIGNHLQLNVNVRNGTATIPENGIIASSQMIPITPGKYLVSNYDWANSPCYDESGEYIGYLTGNTAYNSVYIPSGYAFIRISFKAYGESQSSTILKSFEDANNIIVYETDTPVAPYRDKFSLPMQVDGTFISPNYLDKVIPSMKDSEFISAMKCLAIREINKRDHAYRFGNFNIWINTGIKGYYYTRRMLMDYGVDFCGFEEASSRNTDIGKYLESWQFASGFESPKNENGNVINALSIVSRFNVQTWNTYTLTSVTGNKDCINARIRLPRLYDVYNPYRILSMYAIHPMIGANRVALANEFLSIVANDTSDYIVVVSDSNDFADIEENKLFWKTLQENGLRPVIPLESKTVTQDGIGQASDTYPEKQWYWNCIDQIFVSSNVECLGYNVINTKDEYPVEDIRGGGTNNEPALSDHDFVYADLRFKNEVRSNMPVLGSETEPSEEAGN